MSTSHESTQRHRHRPRSQSQPSLASLPSFSTLSALPTEESHLGLGLGLGISLSAPADLKRRPKHARGRSGASALSGSQASRSTTWGDDEAGAGRGVEPGMGQADSTANLLQQPDHLRASLLHPLSASTSASTAARRAALERQPTLLARSPQPGELEAVIGKNGSGKLRRRSQTLPSLPRSRSDPYGADLNLHPPQPLDRDAKAQAEGVPLEQAKSLPRVELDLRLECPLAVEGGSVRGLLELSIRAPVSVMGGKLRVVGFEELTGPSERHVFYQQSVAVDEAVGEGRWEGVFLRPRARAEEWDRGQHQPGEEGAGKGDEDEEGYRRAREGTHRVKFDMRLPIGGGAKGCIRTKLGQVRYIVIASLKLKFPPNGTKPPSKSIAHFFRPISLYPLLPPLPTVLAPLPTPLTASASKRLGPGELGIIASLERGIWVAGGSVWARVEISNGAGRKVRGLTLSLVRCVTAFRPLRKPDEHTASHHSASTDASDGLSPSPSTTSRKIIATSQLDSGSKASGPGHASAKGWWVGVDPGSVESVCFSVRLPEEEISVRRGKLLEVAYRLRVSVACGGGALAPLGAGEVALELPLWVVGWASMDPPPGQRVVGLLPGSIPGSVDVTPDAALLGLGAGLGELGAGGALGASLGLGMDLGALGYPAPLPSHPGAGAGADEREHYAAPARASREQEQRMLELLHPGPGPGPGSVSESEARRLGSVMGSERGGGGGGVEVEDRRAWESAVRRAAPEVGGGESESDARRSVLSFEDSRELDGAPGSYRREADRLHEPLLDRHALETSHAALLDHRLLEAGHAEPLNRHSLEISQQEVLDRQEAAAQRERDERMIIGDLDWHEQVRISTLQSLHRKQRERPDQQPQAPRPLLDSLPSNSRTPASSRVSSLSPLGDFPSPPPLDASQRASLELVRSMRASALLSAPPSRQSSASSQQSDGGSSSSVLERKDSASSAASSIASLPSGDPRAGLKKSRPLPQLPPRASPAASLASSRLSFTALSPLGPPPRITSSPRSFSPPMLRKVPVPSELPPSVSPASSTSSTMSVREKVAHFEAEKARRETILGGGLSRSSTMASQRSLALSPALGSPVPAEVQRGVSFKAPLFKHMSVVE
ncbi:hypothetical protein CALCODRAFT_487102 [Calocera cornea HHB12733]|uniref:Arrestin C-terminal-like domain-containing protein n=1 Tax=Calocera cornea HHB12733 TaxID=1353952 RepID=A0A165DBG9_9BASI|nr:hypothetical protein CALCODRAFT_487102 [Calocera cornea HHB12733]